MTFDVSSLTLYVDYSKVKSSDVGDHEFVVLIVDTSGLASTYKMKVVIKAKSSFLGVTI